MDKSRIIDAEFTDVSKKKRFSFPKLKDLSTPMLIAVLIGAPIGLVAWVTLSAILTGLFLQSAWAWFVIPTFGAPPLSLPIAIGLGLLRHAPGMPTVTFDSKDQNKVAVWATPILGPLMGWGLAWIVHLFV